MTITRRFVSVGGQRIVHYRRAGSGPPVVLLHASPRSSTEQLPLIEALADRFSVFAIDAPGYGGSDRLKTAEPDIAAYGAAMVDTLGALGLDHFAIYGRHTGAFVAAEVAARLPGRVAVAVYDGFPLFTPAEGEEFLGGYLPPLTPRWDGLHLPGVWLCARENAIHFPWHLQTPERRRAADVPPAAALQETVMDVLRAGAGYHTAYAQAFRYRPAPLAQSLTYPTHLLYRDGDPIVHHRDRVGALPSTAKIVTSGPALAAWTERVAEAFASASSPSDAPAIAAEPRIGKTLTPNYIDLPNGQIIVRRGGRNSDSRPLLMLHDSPGAGDSLGALPGALATSRCVVVPDLPGHGRSDPLIDLNPDLAAYAQALERMLGALGISSIDVYARLTSVPLAIALVTRGNIGVGNTVLDDVPLTSASVRSELIEQTAPPIILQDDGSHLLQAWHRVRDHELFWPWYDRRQRNGRVDGPGLAPERLDRRVVEMLEGRDTYQAYHRAAWCAPLEETLPTLSMPILFMADADDVFSAPAQAAARLIPAGTFQLRPKDEIELAAAIAAYLD